MTACLSYIRRPSHLTSHNTVLTLLLLCPHCSSCFQTVFPGTETTMAPVSQTCCNYFSHLSLGCQKLEPSCATLSFPAKQEVIFLLIGRIPAVSRSVLSNGRLCGNTRVLESGRGRMQVDCSSLCQFLIMWYQSISLRVCVCVLCHVYTLLSGVFCKIEFRPPDLLWWSSTVMWGELL